MVADKRRKRDARDRAQAEGISYTKALRENTKERAIRTPADFAQRWPQRKVDPIESAPEPPDFEGSFGTSALDMAAVLPARQSDPGGLINLLACASRQLDNVPYRLPPSIVMLARCTHAFTTIGAVSGVLYEECVPPAYKCKPVAEDCRSICRRLISVTSEELFHKHIFDRDAFVKGVRDLQLSWAAPNVSGCVNQMLHLAVAMRDILEKMAADESALPAVRAVADDAAGTAEFIWHQYM